MALLDITELRELPLDANGRPVAGSRAYPDGEIAAGTPIPGLVPLPGLAMAPIPNGATVVAVGGYVLLRTEACPLRNGLVTGRGLDNRAGVATLVKTVLALKGHRLNVTVTHPNGDVIATGTQPLSVK